MRTRARFRLLHIPALLVLPALVAGCENEAASRRAEAQAVIAEASSELDRLWPATLAADEPSVEQTRAALEGVVRKLSSVGDVEAGQQAAAARLASTALRTLAALDMGEIDAIESTNRRARGRILGQIDQARRLESMASGSARISDEPQRAMLSEERTVAERNLGGVSARLAELDGPIADREARNEADGVEVARLDDAAMELRRTADSLTHTQGLGTFEEAIRLEREADRHEFEIATREADLRYDLQPEHDLAEGRVEFLRSMLSEISATQDSLDERAALIAGDVSATRQLVGSFGQRIEESVAEIDRSTGEDLSPRYDVASDRLDQAVAKAKRALGRSPREHRDAAAVAVARAHALAARLHWSRARGMEDHAIVLGRLAEAGAPLGGPQTRSAATEARTTADEWRSRALAEFTSASEALEPVKASAATDLAAFRQGLADSIAMLGDDRPARDDLAEIPADDAAAGEGFATPEALIEALGSADPADMTAAQRLLDIVHVETPRGRRFLETQREQLAVMSDLFDAMAEQFGGGAAGDEMLAGMSMGASVDAIEAPRLESKTDDRAVVAYSSMLDPNATLELVRIDGAWMIDGETMIPEMDPQTEAMTNAMLPKMNETFRNLTGRLRAGEFESPEAFQAAMMAVFQSMFEPAGGMQAP